MRIGLVIERMEPWRGGAETSTAQFAAELTGRGHEVALFTASRGVIGPGVRVHTVPLPRTRARRANGFARAIAAALEDSPCDVVHSMTALYGGDVFMPRSGTVAETIEGNLRIRRRPAQRRAKRLLDLLNHRQRTMLRIERRLLTRQPPPRIVALSRYVVEQLSAHYGLGPERVVEVFNAVAVPAPDEQEESRRVGARAELRRSRLLSGSVGEGTLLLLFVAHNFKLKGLAQLLDACHVLSHSRPGLDWRLLIVGRDRPGPYVARCDRLGLTERVTFVGPSERMWRFYVAADLCVLPTFYDPCSRVVLESICLGTPAVTTRYNGAAEVLNGLDGQPPAGAVIADPHDADELAAAIAAFADPERRRASGQAGRALRPRLSMARHADEMLAVYRDVAGGST